MSSGDGGNSSDLFFLHLYLRETIQPLGEDTENDLSCATRDMTFHTVE